MQLAKGLKSLDNRPPGIRMAYLSLEYDIASADYELTKFIE